MRPRAGGVGHGRRSRVSVCRVVPERLEVFESRFDLGVGQPVGAESGVLVDRFWLPAGVDLEVPHCGGYRRPVVVVEDDQSTWMYELAKEEEVDEHVVEDVAAVHERGICQERS